MLVISNGAFKCGSTWLFNILMALRSYDWPAEQFLTGGNTKHPAIAEPKLKDYLDTAALDESDVISKNHLGNPEHRALLLGHDAVRVFCMTRDSRDVIVSAFYHSLRKTGIERSFAQFYWSEGRNILPVLAKYTTTWAEPHPHKLATTFEALKSDFHGEVERIAGQLNVSVPLPADPLMADKPCRRMACTRC